MTLPGFESVPGNGAGSFIGAPWRVCLHTTEGSSVAGAVGAYQANNSWPHFTVDCVALRKVQHNELNVAARALKHNAGTVETNRANAIQIELVGFAAETPDWPSGRLDWLRDEVIVPIHNVCPFAWNAPAFVAYPQSAGLGAAQRFSDAQWLSFSGICGHEHAPGSAGNDHGDPGAIDVARLLTHPTQPTIPLEDDTVLYLIKGDASPGILLSDLVSPTKTDVRSGANTDALLKASAAAGRPIITNNGAPIVLSQNFVDGIGKF